VAEGVAALEKAIPLMEGRRDFIGAAFSRGWLAIGYATLGEFDKAESAVRRATELAAGGDLIAQLDAQIAEAMVRAMRGDLDGAAPIASACVERAEQTGATACAVVSAWLLGDILHRQTRYEPSRQALQLGLDLAPGVDQGVWGPTLQAWLRANPATPSEWDAAGWEELLSGARRMGNRLGEAAMLTKRAEAAARRERWDVAVPDLEAAATIYETQGARPPLARALRSLAAAHAAVGRASDQVGALERARVLFEVMGLEREAREVAGELEAARARRRPRARRSAGTERRCPA
jgi:tetratricopeptide (TPR) repeat protein